MREVPAVEAVALSKSYGDLVALDDVTLQIPRASAFGLLAPHGAGKTTFLHLLLGRIEPTTGQLRVLGRSMATQRQRIQDRVGAVVSTPLFPAGGSAREILARSAMSRGPAARYEIVTALGQTGLAAVADDPVDTFTRGMRVRLALARCLLTHPELLVIDEPLAELSAEETKELRAVVRTLTAFGLTVVIASRSLEGAKRVCDLVALLDEGRILGAGATDEVVGGEGEEFVLACGQPARAAARAARRPWVRRAWTSPQGLHVVLVGGAPAQEALRDQIARFTHVSDVRRAGRSAAA